MFRTLAAATLMTFLIGVHVNAGIIDSFETGQSLLANSASPMDSSVVSGAGILGTERDGLVSWSSGPNDVELEANAGGSALLNFSLGADTSGDQTIITWDGVDGAPSTLDHTGLGSVDLTESGALSAISVSVEFDDLPVHLWLEVYTDANNWSRRLLALPGGIVDPTMFQAGFASFVPQVGAADFTDVGAIRLIIDDLWPATDLQLGFVETTPEPASLSLLVLGGVALLRRRRS